MSFMDLPRLPARGWLLQRRLAAAGLPTQGEPPPDVLLLAHLRWPFALLAGLVLLGLLCAPFPGAYWRVMGSEQGVVENGTVLVALMAMVVAGQLTRGTARQGRRWLAVWFGFFALGAFFLAGEEASWGQQWFHWPTPAEWAARNIQGETNFHNTSQLTEEIPKNTLSLAVLLTGLLWPLWAGLRGEVSWLRRTPLGLIWPSAILWPSAAIAFLLRAVERVEANLPGVHHTDPLLKSLKEGSELFMVLFVLAYLLDMRRRVLPGGGGTGKATDPS